MGIFLVQINNKDARFVHKKINVSYFSGFVHVKNEVWCLYALWQFISWPV